MHRLGKPARNGRDSPVAPPPPPSVPTSREYLVFLGAAQVAARHPGPLTPEPIDQCLNDAIAILDRLIERRKKPV